jgi:hypothetical protein
MGYYGDGSNITGVVDTTASDDIAILGFKVAANGTLARYDLVDQSIDAFEDATGVDASASTNEVRDASGKYYSGSSEGTLPTGDGTVTTNGDYTVHTFTSSGDFIVNAAGSDIDALLVGGGGGGGFSQGGGGGGGGILFEEGFSLTAATYAVVVGGGGGGGSGGPSPGTVGSDSTFNSLTGLGGGRGAGNPASGGDGGSGGGAAGSGSGGAALQPTSTDGGFGYAGGSSPRGGGGGGAGAVGNAGSGPDPRNGGSGGSGKSYSSEFGSIGGSSGSFSGGGGGGPDNASGGGGGGSGAGPGGNNDQTGTSATANTGSGGGGGDQGFGGGSGGSGIVAIRFNTNDAFDQYLDMTLVSNAQTAQSAPTTGFLVMTYTDGAGTATINTDIKAYISRNGSAYTSAVTLVSKGTTGGHTILTANNVDLSGITTGTSMRWKIETLNQGVAKQTRIQAVSLGWS